MIDQATQLRNLALRATRQSQAISGPAPRQIVFAGGKGGVGTTTLAVLSAQTLAEQGWRVVLVDADLYRADVAMMCGLPDQQSVGDILTGHCDLHEALQRGPTGLQILPGLWAPQQPLEYKEAAVQRLLSQFATLGRHADIVLSDSGSGTGDMCRRLWQQANDAVVVTTADDVAVMDSYATIKLMPRDLPAVPHVHLLVNQARDESQARDVYRRIQVSCQRFLQLEVRWLGWLPSEPSLATASTPAHRFNSGLHPCLGSIVAGFTDGVERAASPRAA